MVPLKALMLACMMFGVVRSNQGNKKTIIKFLISSTEFSFLGPVVQSIIKLTQE